MSRELEFRSELTALWLRSRPELQRRIDALETAARAAAGGPDSPAQRALAIREAHRLIGSIGNFGFVDAAAAAQEMEATFQAPGGPDPARLEVLLAVLRSVVARDVLPSADGENVS